MPLDTFTKQPYEELLKTVDFTNGLSSTETVSSATVIVTDLATDTDTSSTMAGTPSVSSPNVTVMVKAGTTGKAYSISFRAVTSLSQKLEADIRMNVTEDE